MYNNPGMNSSNQAECQVGFLISNMTPQVYVNLIKLTHIFSNIISAKVCLSPVDFHITF